MVLLHWAVFMVVVKGMEGICRFELFFYVAGVLFVTLP